METLFTFIVVGAFLAICLALFRTVLAIFFCACAAVWFGVSAACRALVRLVRSR
jgi:hypothetical protein